MASKVADFDPGGLFAHDRDLGSGAVCGADEAGRGCLAGPIVAAAVILDRDCLETAGDGRLSELNDSKRLTPKARERVLPEVLTCALRVCVVMRSSRHIDSTGLHITNIECLSAALEGAGEAPGLARLVDGFSLPGTELSHRRLVKGDSKSAAVAAASVVAKVTRDRYMVRAAADYPEYGFEGHKGYASQAHRDAIRKFGPSPLHRLSFNSDSYVTG